MIMDARVWFCAFSSSRSLTPSSRIRSSSSQTSASIRSRATPWFGRAKMVSVPGPIPADAPPKTWSAARSSFTSRWFIRLDSPVMRIRPMSSSAGMSG